MTDLPSTDLSALLERVEKATGANFELECSLSEALAMPTEWFGSPVVSHFRMGSGYGFNTADGFRHHDGLTVPAYTASLDAALGLVERVLPGSDWTVTRRGVEGQPWACIISPTKRWSSYAPTPALALLASLLSALIASEGGSGPEAQ